MAGGTIPFLVNIDLTKHELLNAVVQRLPSDPSSPAEGQVYYNTASKKLRQYNGTSWVEYGEGGGTGSTNLSATRTSTQVTIASDTGDDATIPPADASNAGVMPAADKSKLDNIEANADVTDAGNVASSINGVSAKTTPVSADKFPILDSADSNALKTLAYSALLSAITDALVDGAPGTLDTLNEIAAALGDDPNFATTITGLINAIDTRVDDLEANSGPAKVFTAAIGDGSATSFTVHPPFNVDAAMAQLKDATTGEVVIADISMPPGTDDVTIEFANAPAEDAYLVVVTGR